MGRRQRFLRPLEAACASAIVAAAFVGGPAAGQDDPVPPSELAWITSELPATPRFVEPEGSLVEFHWGGIAALPTGEAVVAGTEIIDGGFDLNPAARWSPDGVAWEVVTLPGPEDELGTLVGIATTPSGFVVAGFDFPGYQVWTSTDGHEWSPSAKVKDDAVRGVSSSSLGPVLTGSGKQGATLWRLDQNGNWKPTTVAKKGEVREAVVSDDGVWLVRGLETVGKGASATGKDRVWRSTDGRSWQQVDVRRTAAQDGSPFDIASLVAVPGGFLATANYGGAGSYVTTIMASPDGLEWTEVTRVERLITTLVSGPLGVLALGPGSGPGTGAVLRSVDGGVTWEDVPERMFDGETSPTLATATADGFIALGQPFEPGVELPPMVWRATVAPSP